MTMDPKTIAGRQDKAAIMLRIADISEDRKKELIEKYYDPEKHLVSTNAQKTLIGNWFDNAVKMMRKGATEEELNRVVEHIIVLLGAVKYQLNVQKSYVDNNLLGLSKKYFVRYKKIKTKEGEIIFERDDEVLKKRKELVEKRNKKRQELKEKARNMKDSGCTNEYIAEELNVPESTIRSMLVGTD